MAATWDAYLTVEGVKGESRRAGHEEEIEIISFSFGASNPSSIGVGVGGGIGAVDIHAFSFEKYTDAASAEMFKACCQGNHFPTAKVTLYKAGGEGGPVDYLIFEFEEVYVDNIQWVGTQSNDDPMSGIPKERVSFSFGKVVVTYNQQDLQGAKSGSFRGSWDIRSGTA